MSVAAPLRSDRVHSAPAAPRFRAALGALCLLAGLLIIVAGTRLNFFNDDWYLLLQRPGLESHAGLDALLAAHNGNMVVILAAAYKLVVAAFGMHAVWAFRLVTALSWAALGIVVHALVRPRLGSAAALLGAALVLFLGPAWEVMLFFAGINHLWALTLGLLSLALLERDTAARNATACAALTLGVAASNTGLALTAGVAVAILTRRRPRQLWIVAVPVAVYGLWWLAYGRTQPTGITLGHIAALPGYVFDALSIGLAALLGLEYGTLPGLISTGHLAAVLVLIALVGGLARGGRPRPQALWFASALIVFWLLTGASAIPGREAASSRYQLTDAVLILLIAAELLHGVALTRRALGVLAALVVMIVAANIVVLHDGYAFLRAESAVAAADTGALQIARPALRRDVWLTQTLAGDGFLSGVTARRYLSQTAAHGAPPFDTPAQLLAAPAPQRVAADRILIAAEQIGARVVPTGTQGAACLMLISTSARRATAPLSTPAVIVHNLGPGLLGLALSRFGPAGSADPIAFLPGRASELVAPPRDRASVPWRLSIIDPGTGAGRVAVCGA